MFSKRAFMSHIQITALYIRVRTGTCGWNIALNMANKMTV